MENKVYITSLSFNDGTTLPLSDDDIVIFTGSNNCGKSQILRDINNIIPQKDYHNKVVVRDVIYKKEGDVESLKQIFKLDAGGNNFVYNNISVYKGFLAGFWATNKDLGNLTPLFVNLLSTENRLADSKTSPSFDNLNGSPSNPVQVMHRYNEIATIVSDLFHQAFGQHLTLNKGNGTTLPLHIGDIIEWTKENDRTSSEYLGKLSKQPTLDKQGDGMRSFASIMMNVLTAEQTITLIDEPEAFLHPPQARLLGKMLVKNKPNKRQLFISTHSEDFLKGILDSNSQNVKVVRIDREENINKINALDNSNIKLLWNDPLLRYSNILSGLFHRKVVVCESDADCRFYQAIMNAMFDGEEHVSPDILFTHCGGKDRIKTVVKALRSLNVNVVAVTDIDILNDRKTFQDITEAFGIEWTTIESHWNNIFSFARSKSHIPTKRDVKDSIDAILTELKGAEFTPDAEKAIKKAMKNTSGWTQIKEDGSTAFRGGSLSSYKAIDVDCRTAGLFIVPVGELECFHKEKSDHGNKWLNQVLVLDLKNDPDLEQARQFVKEIIK